MATYNTFTQEYLDKADSLGVVFYLGSNPASLNQAFPMYQDIKLVAKEGVLIESAYMIKESGGIETNESFNVVADKKSTQGITIFDTDYIGFDGITTKPFIDTYELTQNDIDSLTNSGVTLLIDGTAASVGDNLGYSDLVFTCDEDHIFDVATASYPYQQYNSEGELETFYDDYVFQQSTDSKTATGNLENTSKTRTGVFVSLTIVTIETTTPPTDNKNGFTNVYSLTDVDMVDVIENSKFTLPSGDTYDGINFIQTLYVLPFDIGQDYIKGKSDVYLGEGDTGVEVDYLDKREIEFTGGSILTAGEGDLRDYANKKGILHVPFFDPIDIDLSYVIDQTIELKYVVNTYTGDCTLYIYSSKNGAEISNITGKLGVEIPYKTAFIYDDAIKYGLDSGQIFNGLKTAFIEIVSTTDSNSLLSKFLIPILDNGNLENKTGYILVNDCDLISSGINSDELNRIESILKNGVIIK